MRINGKYQITGRWEQSDFWSDDIDEIEKEVKNQYVNHEKAVMVWEYENGKIFQIV